ncbi:MAG TPA: glycosyltransferase [Steroidobacteraceae bacterium]|jgi:glycosyltransferase involved in cell wall biosynthesis
MPSVVEKHCDDGDSTNPPEPSTPESRNASRPIRVLIVDTAIAFGGTLAVARNLLKHLDGSLVDASLVSACSDGFVTDGFAGQAGIRLLAPPVDYVTLQNWKRAIRRRFRWAPLRRIMELAAMATELLANMSYVIRLAKMCRQKRVDVLHANNFALEPLWAARILGIAIVSHLHGFLYLPMERSRRRTLRHVDAFVSISRAVTESAVRAGVDRARIHEIPNFVEHAPEASPPAMPTELAIGIFGRVTHWKGQKEFLCAAMRVLPGFPSLRIYIVGDASDSDPRYFEECREFAQSSPFAGQFNFAGLVTDVAAYYRKCTVVVHASIEPEPFGMVVIEAMAEARPVVASVLGAPPEIIEDGVDGYLVDPKDIGAMTDRITMLLADSALATNMGIRGHKKVLANYDPTIAAQRFARLYGDVVRLRGK